MRRQIYSLFIMMIIQTSTVYTQIDGFSIGKKYIAEKSTTWGLTSDDIATLAISSQAKNDMGITYLYLNQTIDGVVIRNAMITLVIDKEGKVLSDQHNFIPNVKARVNTTSTKLTVPNAIKKAGEHLGVAIKSEPIALGRNHLGRQAFQATELAKSEILAMPMYELVGEKLVLVWNLQIDQKNTSDYWDLNIDAINGQFVSKHNYTTYCHHAKGAYGHDQCVNTFMPKAKSSSQAMPAAATATYNVFALPAESPNHASRSMATDGLYPIYSPYGWHDTNGADGAEFTITRGNNVYAYQDKNDDDVSDTTDTEGGLGLVFDFPIDLNEESRKFPDAAVTNLFYMNNMIHDISAAAGFTEEFGNFQQKNYTNKGDGGDYVLAQAFDGITLHEAGQTEPPKINNANFSTPIDGFNGRMQMYFWDNEGGAVSIDEPESIKGFIPEYGTGQFGRPLPNSVEPAVVGALAIAKDGSTNPFACCNTITNPSEIAGKIAIIERGICDFSNKVFRAQQAGAIAAIICNIPGVSGGNGEEVLGMASGLNGGSVTIPSILLKKSDCDKIKLVLANNENVIMTWQERERVGPDYLDGSLDNGIIAHEFGHGISTRLTGGRLNSSCLGNDEQMGEGWSDFFALALTHEPGDKGSDARGIGTYAQGQLVTGSGIRRYRYSTDMAVNPQTYDDIKGTTAPHPLGEVWTDMLWDMYWGFVDKYGYNPDYNVKTSGNYKAVSLVIEGMKIQGCNPGFINGRNAILRADSIYNNGENGRIIWEAFARRGLGYYADGGLNTNRNDGTEDFEIFPLLIEKLKITKTITSSVDAGQELNVTIKVLNHIPSRQNSVVITDYLEDGLTYVSGSSNIEPTVNGDVLSFSIGDMEYRSEFTLTFKLKTDPTKQSIQTAFDNFDGDILWDTPFSEIGNISWLPSYDLFRSPEVALYMYNEPSKTDASLISTPIEVIGANPAMRFWHQYNTQLGFDGGFVEISVDGGVPEIISKDKFFRNGYNSELAYATLAIPALGGFSGSSENQWVDSYIDLSDYAGKTVQFIFRFASDETLNSTTDFAGWFIDDFEMLDVFKYTTHACVGSNGGNDEQVCTDVSETFINAGVVGTKDENIDFFQAHIMPNPANDYFVINAVSPYTTTARVEMINLEGKVVRSMPMNLGTKETSMVVNTMGLSSGFYMVRIISGQQTSIKKVIIN